MANPGVQPEESKRRKKAIEDALRRGLSPLGKASIVGSAVEAAAKLLSMPGPSLANWVRAQERDAKAGKVNFLPDWSLYSPAQLPDPEQNPYAIEFEPPIGSTTGAAAELESLPGHKYRFAAIGDLHAASKYCRWDVREDLIKRAEDFGAQVIFDTGNWIDGEMRFNRYDLEVVGLDQQCKLLAERHPKTKIPIWAVTGADHEGWYVKSEGIDVGRYCESIMRDHGHDWTNLGYMEADVMLRNRESRKASVLRNCHPGGGSAYALSYSIQKIIESYEGGEKPAIGLFGHYHKMMAALIRNVWTIQTGCAQDQTPFMRQKRIEAHVGGVLVELEQSPVDGSIISMTPQLIRYYNRAYYFKSGQANNRWSGHGKIKPAPRRANTDA